MIDFYTIGIISPRLGNCWTLEDFFATIIAIFYQIESQSHEPWRTNWL
jgi:hypothetical protein